MKENQRYTMSCQFLYVLLFSLIVMLNISIFLETHNWHFLINPFVQSNFLFYKARVILLCKTKYV